MACPRRGSGYGSLWHPRAQLLSGAPVQMFYLFAAQLCRLICASLAVDYASDGWDIRAGLRRVRGRARGAILDQQDSFVEDLHGEKVETDIR
jgi:hypothetical protein